MYEVEVKVEADHEALRERLSESGAEHVETVVQEDTYYNAPHKDFAATDEALRIRRERQDTEEEWSTAVTYKGPLLEAESKSREEFETGVEDGEVFDDVLTALGFEAVAVVQKERERYDLDGVTVTLDAVGNLGEFVEAELESDSGTIEPVRERVQASLESIGLNPDEQIRTSYLGLLLEGEQ